ncbi:MAG: DUF4430 domain-containing protein [Clostridiales bacterium]|nr:DUF4430 domain-containing protein [Clostridiales bacterium]
MKENKKKYIIALVAFAVFAVLFAIGLKANSIYSNTLTNKQMSAQESQDKSSGAGNISGNTAKANKDGKNVKNTDAANSSAGIGSSSAGKKGKSSINSSTKSKKGGSGNTSSKSSNPSTVTSNGIVKVSASDPESSATFQVVDTVHGNKMIISRNIDSSMNGQTVGYITERILDSAKISYKATGSASTLYFAAIDGLEEKKAGKLSGWCYYVKKKGDSVFHKPNIGSGQWVWHTGDVVVWRYLADGINDGYGMDWGKGSF